MTTIKSHGFKFNIEAGGFVKIHAEADRETGIDAIQSYIDSMGAVAVAQVHAADVIWATNGCSGERPWQLEAAETLGHNVATREWHRPDAAYFIVSAAQ